MAAVAFHIVNKTMPLSCHATQGNLVCIHQTGDIGVDNIFNISGCQLPDIQRWVGNARIVYPDVNRAEGF